MNSDFKELLSILNEEQVRYLVVGGYAVIEYTEPRYTKDLDVWVSTDKENAEKVFIALRKFGAPLEGITVEDFQDSNLVYHMGRPPARVDILMGVSGLDFERAWGNRVGGSYGDVKTNFISLEDLIINKREAGRLQDLMDAENLFVAREQIRRRRNSDVERQKEQKPRQKR